MAALAPRYESPPIETPIDAYMQECNLDKRASSYDKEVTIDYHRLFIANMHEEVENARANREHVAYSYRPKPFIVGGILLAVERERNSHAWYNAGNLKLQYKIGKYCAEEQMLDEAESHGYKEVTGIIAAGTSDKDEIEGVTFVRTETLHHCDVCRGACEKSPLVKPDTLHVTTKDDPSTYQVQTYAQMAERYAPENMANFKDPWAHALDKGSMDERLRLYGMMVALRETMPSTERLSSAKLAYTALAGAML